MRKTAQGFSLVELLVVVSIIAILAGISISIFSTAQNSAKDTKRKTDLAAIAKALEEGYNITSGQYQIVESSDFTSGATLATQDDGSTKVTFPDNSSFKISLGANNSSFNVCGTLSDNSLYCRSSVRGTPPTTPTSIPGTGGYVLFDPTPTPTTIPDPPRNVFVTSEFYGGNLGGLNGADNICQTLATTAGLSGTYKAWLSDTTHSVTSRFFHGNGPYRLLNGTVIANNWSELTDGLINESIHVTETGEVLRTDILYGVYTDTTPSGEIKFVSYPPSFNPVTRNCNDWTSNRDDVFAWGGYHSRKDASWTDSGGISPCSGQVIKLYCFQQ